MKTTSPKRLMTVLGVATTALLLNGCTTNPATGPLNTGNTPAENTLPKIVQVALNSSQEKAASQQETQELNPLLKNATQVTTTPESQKPLPAEEYVVYKNSKVGFKLTVPKSWHLPEVTDQDPHFYSNKNCADGGPNSNELPEKCSALEVMAFEENASHEMDSVFKNLKSEGQKPAYTTKIIPGATMIKADASPAAEGWMYEYHVLFPTTKQYFVIFSNDAKLENSILSSFRPIEKKA